MSWLRDLLGVYGRVLRRTVELTARHWWLGLVATAYLVTLSAVRILAAPFSTAGGFASMLVTAALGSSALVLLGHVVRDGRTTPADLPGSFGVYLGDVLTFFFLMWAMGFVAAVAFANLGYAAIVFQLAVLVFLSAVPEQIYLEGETGAAVFVGSYQFVGRYWIEWLPAAALLATLIDLAGEAPAPASLALRGFVGAFAFVARGLLFRELTTSSRRARDFQRRAWG